jgi:hypothetical protein
MIGAPGEPMLEGWTTISALAGVTTKIKLGTLVNEGKTRNIVNKFLQKPIKMDVLINEIQTQIT